MQLSLDREGKGDNYESRTVSFLKSTGRYNTLFLRVELEYTLPCPSLWFYSSPGNDVKNRFHLFYLIHLHPVSPSFPSLVEDRVSSYICLLLLGEVMLRCHVRIGSSIFMLPSSLRLSCHEPPVVRYKLLALLHPSVFMIFISWSFSDNHRVLFCLDLCREELAVVCVLTHTNSPLIYMSLLLEHFDVQVQIFTQLKLWYILTPNFLVWTTLNHSLAFIAYLVWRTLNQCSLDQYGLVPLLLNKWWFRLGTLSLRDLVPVEFCGTASCIRWIHVGMDRSQFRSFLDQIKHCCSWCITGLSCHSLGTLHVQLWHAYLNHKGLFCPASVVFGFLCIHSIIDRICRWSISFVWDVTCMKLMMYAGSLQPP